MLSLSITFAPGLADVRVDALRDWALSWHIPAPVQSIRGLRLFIDAPRGSGPLLSVVRSIVRANPRIGALDALELATDARDAARQERVDPQFIAATLLQESAFDPNAISAAGAYGIAQFTIPTAQLYGIDPFDPRAAIAGATHVLATYLMRYAHVAGDPYACALAAYNAGPRTVTFYGGVPPYPETREYIADIHERWARLLAER
jgi:soluble lytic murein transglycosylase-like protein